MKKSFFLNTYLQNRPLFLSLVRARELELFSRYIPFQKPICDVGCGDGFFARTLYAHRKNQGRIDVGLDVVGSRMEEARGLGVYEKCVYYDGVTIPFKKNIFSTVISNCVFEHVANIEHLVSEIYRVLQPGGQAIVSVMAKPWEEHLFGSLIFGHSYTAFMRAKQKHVHVLTREHWSRLFQNAGFTEEKCEGYLSPHACKFIDFAHYVSIPNLLTYVLFKKWVVFPQLVNLFPVHALESLIREDVSVNKAGALFFVLRKK